MGVPNWAVRDLENQIMPRLRNCSSFAVLKQIHAQIVASSLGQSCFLSTQIISVCNAIGRMDYAALVFNQVEEPNLFLYNSMIRAYTQRSHFVEAIEIFKQMLRQPKSKDPIFADRFTYPFVVKASGGLHAFDLGKQCHAQVFKLGLNCNSIVQNSLLEMYTLCDCLYDAHHLFDEMDERDVVSWNMLISAHARLRQMRKARSLFDSMPERTIISWTAMISGYTSIGCFVDAVEVFREMQLQGFNPDDVSIVSVLPACTQLGALELGKWIHAYCNKHRMLERTYVCNALIEMYAKCGSIDEAYQIFDNMRERDVISWSTMIAGLATHGRAREAIQLFLKMENEKRVRPNCITFLGLLSACSHAGLLDEGLQFFDSMKEVYGIPLEIEHYGCIVDLLSRSGCITQALELIKSMPIQADVSIWGSLLSACKTHGDVETATMATEKLLELAPRDTGNYVQLSNIYAAAGRWDGVAKMRKLVRSRNMKKTPGCSLIEVNNIVQEFVAGDETNPLFVKISEILELLATELGRTDDLRTVAAEAQSSFMDVCAEPEQVHSFC